MSTMEWENWCTKDRYKYFILNLSIEVGFINVDSVNTWSTKSIIFLVVYEMNVVFIWWVTKYTLSMPKKWQQNALCGGIHLCFRLFIFATVLFLELCRGRRLKLVEQSLKQQKLDSQSWMPLWGAFFNLVNYSSSTIAISSIVVSNVL